VTVAERAREVAGNYRKMDNLLWSAQPDDADKWALFGTVHRDSGNIDKSNAATIEREICEVFSEDAHIERFQDWLVGWSENLVIRVYDAQGEITPAFQAYDALARKMENYPLLDEDLYGEMEADSVESTIEMAIEQLSDIEMKNNLPEGWVREVWQKLSEMDSDIRGDDWWPKEEGLRTALHELGYVAPSAGEIVR
jgi:hypothetical protein